ncbi:hypothetical protein GCM10023264_03460 [Sphingomonas daechungensis]
MILIDRELIGLGDCIGDGAAHPPIRSEEADADRLLVSAHIGTDGSAPVPAQQAPARDSFSA